GTGAASGTGAAKGTGAANGTGAAAAAANADGGGLTDGGVQVGGGTPVAGGTNNPAPAGNYGGGGVAGGSGALVNLNLRSWRGQVRGAAGAGGGAAPHTLSSVLSQLFVSWGYSKAGAPIPTGKCSGCSPEDSRSTGSSALRGQPISVAGLGMEGGGAGPPSIGTGDQYAQLMEEVGRLETDMVACEEAEERFNARKFAAIEQLDELSRELMIQCVSEENVEIYRQKMIEYEQKCEDCRNDPDVQCEGQLQTFWCEEGVRYRGKYEWCIETRDEVKRLCREELTPILQEKSAACPLMRGVHSACPMTP
ncbi:MAG: hypothetical protein ABIJ96_16830, partial [Elusimicrobiota bacterium]